jgi:hypothetical protein
VVGTNDPVILQTTETPVSLIVNPEVTYTIVTAAEQGPRGTDGVSPGAIIYPAATTLSGHMFVYVNTSGQVDVADATVIASAASVVGITTGAVVAGAPVIPQSSGVIVFNGWSFTPGANIVLGTNGQPVQTPVPGSAFTLSVGTALSATKLLISIRSPIINT